MHRQHAALFAVRSIAVSVLRTADRPASSRSPLDTSCCAAVPLLALLLICSGCYGPYQAPAGGFGSPYGYPPAGMPTQTLQPGGTYVPSPTGQPVTPYGTFQQPTPAQPSTINPTGGNAPFYGSGSSAQPSYDGGGVPTYNDPNEVQFKQPVQPDNTAIDSFGSVEGASAAVAGVAKVDLDTADFIVHQPAPAGAPPAESALPPQSFDAASTTLETSPQEFANTSQTVTLASPALAQLSSNPPVTDGSSSVPGEFQPPVHAQAVPQFEPATVEAASTPLPFPGEASPLTTIPAAASMPPSSTFAHDEAFTWLRGVLRFDASSGVWVMTYSTDPAPADEHGGKLLVADSPLLEQFKPQAIVLLRGGIDQTQSAAAGRAVFRADVIEPFEPSGP